MLQQKNPDGLDVSIEQFAALVTDLRSGVGDAEREAALQRENAEREAVLARERAEQAEREAAALALERAEKEREAAVAR